MPKHDRLFLHVAKDARMILPLSNYFNIRKTQSTCIMTDQQFIGTVSGHGYFNGLAIFAYVLQPCTIQRPQTIILG